MSTLQLLIYASQNANEEHLQAIRDLIFKNEITTKEQIDGYNG